MGQIVLVRHGQASFGAADYDALSPAGVRQAQRLGAWLAMREERFDRVFLGPMRRHRQTAEACLAALPIPAPASRWQVHDGLAEYDHEEVIARHRPDLADPEAVQAFLAAAPDARKAFQRVFAEAIARWVGGRHDDDYRETWGEFRTRCLKALAALTEAAIDSDVIVFTSGGPISVICQEILGSPDEKAAELSFVLANGSLTRLLARSGRVMLAGFNQFSYLEDAIGGNLVTYR